MALYNIVMGVAVLALVGLLIYRLVGGKKK